MRLINRLIFIVVSLTLLPITAIAQSPPCVEPEYRQFDFWLGNWQVTQPDGTVAGTNAIQASYNGCVMTEHYQVNGAPYGESLNAYDRATQRWYQTWMDKNGTVLLLSGGMKGDSMVLSGQSKDASGGDVTHQISWQPQANGTVIQHWQFKQADGDWTTLFKGIYTKLTP